MSGVVDGLVDVGLTRNQALAWLELVRDDSGEGLTGYEAASRSGVPRSAIYTVLRQLEKQGACFAVGEDPVRFVAIDPDTWIGKRKAAATAQYDALSEAVRALPRPDRPEPVWIVRRYDEVIARMSGMIRGAEQSIYLSVWARELEALRAALDDVARRDLHRVVHSPDRLDAPPGFAAWIDDIGDDHTKASWSHKAILVVDRREALIGGTEPDVDNHAVWTTNPSLVDVATNHIILDITLLSRTLGRDATDDVAPMMRPHLGE